MAEVNGYKVSMTYQGSQPKVDPQTLGVAAIGSKDATGATVASTTSDQILDLSDPSKLAEELAHQDLNNVKAIKVGDSYLSIPSPEVLKGLVTQLKSVCVDNAGKLRSDFQFINFESRLNPAAANEAASTSLIMNVVGPEPNDGLLSTDRNMDFKRQMGGVHLLQPHDNLVNIARALYGGTEGDVLANAQRLANYNGFANPDRIPAGTQIFIVNKDLLAEVSSKPPKTPAVPGTTPAVPGTTPAVPGTTPVTAPTGTTTATTDTPGPTPGLSHGQEVYNGPLDADGKPTEEGFLNFIRKDAQTLIESYENRETRPYWDKEQGDAKYRAHGRGFQTTGVGHLIKPGETSLVLDPQTNRRVNLGRDRLTDTEVDNLFAADFDDHATAVLKNLKPEVLRELNRNQLAALASLAFNIGPGGIVKGQHKGFAYSPIVTALNGPGTLEERLKLAADGMARYTFSGRTQMGGLVSRRMGDRILLTRPDVSLDRLPGYDQAKLRSLVADLNAEMQQEGPPRPGLQVIRTDDLWPVRTHRPRKK